MTCLYWKNFEVFSLTLHSHIRCDTCERAKGIYCHFNNFHSVKSPLQNSFLFFFLHKTLPFDADKFFFSVGWCWLKLIKYFIFRLSSQYQKSLDEVNETFQFYVSMLEERKAEVVRDLEQAYSGKQVQLSVFSQKAQDTVEKILQVLAWPPFTAILF